MADEICQHHQFGYCKYEDRCVRTHIAVTCNSVPCLDSECSKRHPRRCRFFDMYGRCRFAEQCSYLHVSYRDQEAMPSSYSYRDQEAMPSRTEIDAMAQDISDLREQLQVLRDKNAELFECNQFLIEALKDHIAVKSASQLSQTNRTSKMGGGAKEMVADKNGGNAPSLKGENRKAGRDKKKGIGIPDQQ